MVKTSSGLLMYRLKHDMLEFFIVHPGGPFFVRKDEGVWTIPKGEVDPGEPFLQAAQREFKEETGLISKGPYLELGSAQMRSGKIVHAWAFEGDWNGLLENIFTFPLEWPPRSGKFKQFPEVDRAGFFSMEKAKAKLQPAQHIFLERLAQKLRI